MTRAGPHPDQAPSCGREKGTSSAARAPAHRQHMGSRARHGSTASVIDVGPRVNRTTRAGVACLTIGSRAPRSCRSTGRLRPNCRCGRKGGVSREPRRAAPKPSAFRPEHQRRGRRRRRLLRHASDSQTLLQVTADRAASKHFGARPQPRKRRAGVVSVTAPGASGSGDAHIWRFAGRHRRCGSVLLPLVGRYRAVVSGRPRWSPRGSSRPIRGRAEVSCGERIRS